MMLLQFTIFLLIISMTNSLKYILYTLAYFTLFFLGLLKLLAYVPSVIKVGSGGYFFYVCWFTVLFTFEKTIINF